MIKIDNQKDKRKLTPLKTASACLFHNWLWFLFSKVLFYLQFFANSIDNIINNFRSNADVVERSEMCIRDSHNLLRADKKEDGEYLRPLYF